MGEEAWRVHCVGAPGLDRLARLATCSREELARRLGLPLPAPTLLVTFHPVTLESGDTERHVEELAAALETADGDVIITYPGADIGYGAIIARLEALAARDPGRAWLAAPRRGRYCSLLREADVMVGNSSSGLIEAPSFGLPVVNIGQSPARAPARGQRHRRGAHPGRDPGRHPAGPRSRVPGEPRAAAPIPTATGTRRPRIAKVLAEVELGPRLLRKRFVDLKIAFLASRKGFLKVTGSLIQAALERGHEVVLLRDPGEQKPGEVATAADLGHWPARARGRPPLERARSCRCSGPSGWKPWWAPRSTSS